MGWNLNGLVLEDVPSGFLGASLDHEASETTEVDIVSILQGVPY